eukprot:CAMPEP_0172722786 /NCGR_PEP_ID=MMETSP1074-20121228/82303_1 /TAXON_ID=2916 /ORGANISM="Ceratium fusus, Strain PA161109" /LENGTH=46 /DNA_ID= /DNA_START= /DNA_END= /DNA_ORIENTATION=
MFTTADAAEPVGVPRLPGNEATPQSATVTAGAATQYKSVHTMCRVQ